MPIKISRGAVWTPHRCMITSEPKEGKTHIMAGAPGALFADCERGTVGYPSAVRADIEGWRDFMELIRMLERGELPEVRLLVIDTLDSLERLLMEHVCGLHNVNDIGQIGYGKGWTTVEAEWSALIQRLTKLADGRGLGLFVLAHVTPQSMENPDGSSWKRWSLRVNKKTAELWRGWLDEILFLHRRVRNKAKSRLAESSQRVLETRGCPAWQAGSRRIGAAQVVIPDSPDPRPCWEALAKAYPDVAFADQGPAPSTGEPCDPGPEEPGGDAVCVEMTDRVYEDRPQRWCDIGEEHRGYLELLARGKRKDATPARQAGAAKRLLELDQLRDQAEAEAADDEEPIPFGADEEGSADAS